MILMLSLKLPGPAGQRERRWEESRAGLYVHSDGGSSSSGEQGEGGGREASQESAARGGAGDPDEGRSRAAAAG